MGAFPSPELPLAQTARPKRWPLWAKIATPLGALMVIGGIANACSPPEDEAKSVGPIGTATAELAPTESPSTTSVGPSATTTTVAATTPPPETTTAPTPPPTAAPTIPPPTNPPPTNPPPTYPPPTVPPPPLPIVILTDPRFGTCTEAKANGYGPYYSGTDTEYGWYRDADSDGIVCE